VFKPASDQELLERQFGLQAEATELLVDPRWTVVSADIDPPLVTGSYVSGLMSWRELDVMVRGGPDFTPHDV